MEFLRTRSAFVILFCLAVAGAPALAQDEDEGEENGMTTRQKQSYALGMQVGSQMQTAGGEVDLDAFVEGMRDTLEGQEPKVGEAEAQQLRMEFAREVQERRLAQRAQEGEQNKAEGEAFLAANAEKEEVQVTDSGLQYVVLEAGDGPKPTPEDTVKVHYRGTLINGAEFDSSYRRNEPATFKVTGVIPGWTEALQLMSVGSKYRLFIPADLAYGERGAGPRIGPNATLIFDVELLEVVKNQSE